MISSALENPPEMGGGQNFLSQAANDNTPKNSNQQHKILITFCGLVKMAADSWLCLQMREKEIPYLKFKPPRWLLSQKNEAEVMISNW